MFQHFPSFMPHHLTNKHLKYYRMLLNGRPYTYCVIVIIFVHLKLRLRMISVISESYFVYG